MISPIERANLFSPLECKRIIAIARAETFTGARLVRSTRHDKTRSASVTWLTEDGDNAWAFRRLIGAVAEANRHHFHFDFDEFAERMQVARYRAETGDFFDWHADIGDGPLASRRKLTISVQLSEAGSYEGGDLETNSDGHVRRASRVCGTALLLPSIVLHRVTPVTAGERYSLTLWAHGPEFH